MIKKSYSLFVDTLLEKNHSYSEAFKSSSLMRLIRSKAMSEAHNRTKLLDCIQIFSTYFQKMVLIRRVLAEYPPFLDVAQDHLSEEFNHDLLLMRDRKKKNLLWDPLLDAGSAWFLWKMMSLDQLDKALLMHLVLEESANIFFVEAHKIMQAYGETDYFAQHSELDYSHAQMGIELLSYPCSKPLIHLFELQAQAWDVLNMVCARIAALVEPSSKCFFECPEVARLGK